MGQWEIWVMNADGSDQRPIFETALDEVSIGYEFVGERLRPSLQAKTPMSSHRL